MIGIGCVDIGPKERELINRVLDSGIITSGPILEQFERQFALRHERNYGLMVNSGTDALRIALAALKEMDEWSWDDEIIVPALTFIATSNVVIQNGLKPVFVDVNPRTFNIDPREIERAITSRTRAIIPVHLFGLPCDMGEIRKIATTHNLRVIEDSCEAMGVSYRATPVGAWSDIACFSTYAAHIISTGVGGLAITDDPDLANIMRSLANHGRDPQYLGFRDSRTLRPENYIDQRIHARIIESRFRFERIGYSSRVSQMEAALGLGQLSRIDQIILDRRDNESFLRAELAEHSSLELQEHPTDRQSACMMFPIVINDPEISRREMMVHLERDGVETRPFFNILGQIPYLEMTGETEDGFPIATCLSRNGFYVGCHQQLSEADLWHIVDSVKSFLGAPRGVAA